MIGQSVAHYKVTTKIGAGGMGEVFRATDSRLNRDVALKFLPEQFATDPHRMARFNREAQVLASLSHPNIGAIYGLEQSNGRTALVMELIEGEDLSERMRRGPIPLEESLKIARQIAEALEAAHEKGIIHRDLKPANIKLTPDGQVKVLDFGLAKALEDPSMSSMSGGGEVSQSPTLSIAATKAGIILGTAAYMSPEQASGLPADKRCDVWSFGVVLYEMLVGRRLFTGETVSHTLADVLRADIDFTKLPATTPSSIRKLLERCLDRDKKRRLRDIGEARIVIDDYLAGTVSSGTRRMAAPVATQPAWQRVLPWTIAGFATALLLAAGFMLWRQPAPPQAQSMNIDAKISTDRFWSDIGSGVELSPDGSIIAFIVGTGDRRQLKIRRIDQLDSTVLVDGTSDAVSPYHPFFSPDGKWLGYATSTELRKIPISGGTPLTLCKVSRSRGATWLADDTIVFAPNPASALFRVPASGGEPKALTTIDTKAGEMHRWPQALPGGEAVLFNTLKTLSANANTFDDGIIEVVKLATGERKVIHRGGGYARYLPTGQLVYVNKGTLFGLPFDLKRLEVKGTPAPLVQNITWNAPQGAAQLSFSTSGLLAYVRGAGLVPKYPVVWADRNGNTSQLINEPGTYANPRLSPDGKQVAMSVYRDGNWDIWVYDLARSISTRLTFSESLESEQIWSPDGKYVIYSSRSGGPDNLFRKRADGSGGEEQLTKADAALWANSWSGDGRFLIGTMGVGKFDIFSMQLGNENKAEPYLHSDFNETDAALSPDGRWAAYTSDESGKPEIYVRPFPSGSGRWQVSDGGGGYARWSRSGKEIFFRVAEGIMAAPIEVSGDGLQVGKPRRLFSGQFQGGSQGLNIAGENLADYDVSPDGQRFIMFSAASSEAIERAGIVTLVTSWFDQVSRVVNANH